MNYINHITAIQYRVVGTGILRTTLFGYDEILSATLGTIQMGIVFNSEPVLLTNFQAYKVKLRGEVTASGEIFKVNHIVIYTKPVMTQLPG